MPGKMFIPITILRACLHGGGRPQVGGDVTRFGWVTRLSIQSLILI